VLCCTGASEVGVGWCSSGRVRNYEVVDEVKQWWWIAKKRCSSATNGRLASCTLYA